MLKSGPVAKAQLPLRARSTRYLPLVVFWQVIILAAGVAFAMQDVLFAVLGALILLAGLLLTVPVNGRTMPRTLGNRRAYRLRQREFVEFPDQPQDLVPLGQWLPRLEVTKIKDAHDGEIGIVADGRSWTGILELQSDLQLFSDRGNLLNLDELAQLTRQDDVTFAGIQVITFTVGAPTRAMLPAGSPAINSYQEILDGALPPPAVRRTWLALRLDPRLCLEAVGRRGTGQVGVYATLRFGLHRAQAMLKRQGVSTSTLSPQEIVDVLGQATGVSPEPAQQRTVENWENLIVDSLVHESRAVQSFGRNTSDGYQRLLEAVCAAPVMMAITSYTVSPGEPARGAVRLVSNDLEQAGQGDEAVQLLLPPWVRLGPRGGTQVPGLLATVPLGRQVD
ncbi:type VII secretion protein EccE [Tessaracoccus sp. OH4464_COT-324]|uniref:type VII secretion protein EccE n=1 Tax=Tessaracoccus sp. OH4464_COT-324 TaxID=2491059 RepID=UPI00131A2C4C|nr:type VII secretion protein EccE [Tessaracoccus sp. OH4464_COT-324]